MTLQLPCGTTVLGFVLEQTTINNVLETLDGKLDENRLRAEKGIFLHLNSQEMSDPRIIFTQQQSWSSFLHIEMDQSEVKGEKNTTHNQINDKIQHFLCNK